MFYKNVKIITRSREKLDLTDQKSVQSFFSKERPQKVILAAARVGGIYANNTYPANFIYENLQIQNNVIHAAHTHDVQKLLFLGSSCIYPRLSNQPMREDMLLTGQLESTNEPYAIAKIAGIKMCESYNRQYGRDYRSVMPTNLYGPGDNFHPKNSHVVPALLKRIHEAKIAGTNEVLIWGTGQPKREFLFVDDMAEASLFAMELEPEVYWQNIDPMISHTNVGSGKDITIKTLGELIKKIVGFEGVLSFDTSKPDGAHRKLMNVNRINSLGWSYKTDLEVGLKTTYKWALQNERSFAVT